jgi:hypothetical protein
MPALSWNLIAKGTGLTVDSDKVHLELRSSFAFSELVEWCMTGLHSLLRAQLDPAFHSAMTLSALLDDWPAAIEDAEGLMRVLRSSGRAPIAVTELGLLSLLADALCDPWDEALQPLRMEYVENRLCRLAMMAAEVLSSAEREEVGEGGSYAAELIIASGRLRENDWAGSVLVRTHELYAELLPSFFAGTLPEPHGISLSQWVKLATAIAVLKVDGPNPGVDLSQLEEEASAARAVLTSLSAPVSRMTQRFRKLRADGMRFAPLYLPFREHPFLELSPNLFALVWGSFLLRGIDDRAYFDTLNALPEGQRSHFQKVFGQALEEYVWRILQRAREVAPGSQIHRIQRIDGVGERKRCDFAWRIGEDLLLIESKRVGIPVGYLMGEEGLRQRLDEELGRAALQLLETAEEIAERGAGAVLEAEHGWVPRRVFGWVVSHQPLFMWYSSGDAVLRRQGIEEGWKARFASKPAFLALGELEHLEAALPTLPIGRYLDALAVEHGSTEQGFNNYLAAIGWRGPIASPYYERRKNELMGDVSLQLPGVT